MVWGVILSFTSYYARRIILLCTAIGELRLSWSFVCFAWIPSTGSSIRKFLAAVYAHARANVGYDNVVQGPMQYDVLLAQVVRANGARQ